jgi:hypothetical protein
MGEKLSPKQLELYQGIDEILWKDWDPIGVNDTPEVRDEYYSYLPVVYRMALDHASASEIARYLEDVMENSMGLSPGRNLSLPVAEDIIKLRDKLEL